MQALEFTRALEEIVRELKIQELLSIAQTWSTIPGNGNQIPDPTKNEFAQLILKSNAAYERLAKRADTQQIMVQLDLAGLYEPARVRGMLGNIGNIANSQQIFTNAALFAQIYGFAEHLRAVMRVTSAAHQLLEAPKLKGVPQDERVLELELIEYADEIGISPKRLEIFIGSITELHGLMAMVLDVQGDMLIFKYFDSGSGVLIGIVAAAPIIFGIGTLLNQYWDKIRFYKFDSFEKKVAAISKTLDLADRIQERIDKKQMTTEVGQNITVRVFQELESLTGIGAMVPLKDATIDQRQLLTEIRNTKLLTSGEADNKKTTLLEAQLPPLGSDNS